VFVRDFGGDDGGWGGGDSGGELVVEVDCDDKEKGDGGDSGGN